MNPRGRCVSFLEAGLCDLLMQVGLFLENRFVIYLTAGCFGSWRVEAGFSVPGGRLSDSYRQFV